MAEKEIKGIKKFFEEFKAFAMRGNVLDMAVRCPHCTSKLEGFPEIND